MGSPKQLLHSFFGRATPGVPAATFLVTVFAGGICEALAANASDIARVQTPRSGGMCGFIAEPAPVLANCSEPIPPGVPDHRGEWTNSLGFHWERIEQCGMRYTVTLRGSQGRYVIHDFVRADGVFENGCQDYSSTSLPECRKVSLAGKFAAQCMETRVLQDYRTVFKVAMRCLNGDALVWTDHNRDVVLRRPATRGAPTVSPTASPSVDVDEVGTYSSRSGRERVTIVTCLAALALATH
eukprot:TRINITY_DN64001_c0_g1_i1.p1 TRINITY_DN64001_c0_g1~~TRINITY_DN64001_c0_g1_i1.p1  ORF type:complete len:240 (-),score=18.86 TRINITY_DN64001_c0_g1_i1:322-1041(-)